MSAFVRVAHIVSARNLEGSVVCQRAGALPFLLAEGQTVHFIPPVLKGPRQARVEAVLPLREGNWEVHFSGVENRETAEQLLGLYCLVVREELSNVVPDHTPALYEGFTVLDEIFGGLGVVSDVLESPAQQTLVVQGNSGEILIPFVEEFIFEVDEEARIIHTHIPRGLLELNPQAGQEGE